MMFERASGILLHPTSLPGPYGIGELGPQAIRWIEFLAGSGCQLWQVLPLGPTGYGDSPYQCFSSFAGNPYLISIELLIKDGLLTKESVANMPSFSDEAVDFGAIYRWKPGILDQASERFQKLSQDEYLNSFKTFEKEQEHWLDDFALFMALKDAHGGRPWNEWPKKLRVRDPGTIERASKVHSEAIMRQKFRQFLFFRQWGTVRKYANKQGIRIIGDIPIFVAYDSADVWANPTLFHLDDDGLPKVVAGVPPDYFSETGQLWGNPLYRWELHSQTGYAWWMSRLRSVLDLVDIVRLDHFRGFYNYWEIPAGEETAIRGRWVYGPREEFFNTVRRELGDLPIIAEDLGELDPGVYILRDMYKLPGMKIMVFGFYDNPYNPFLPHNHTQNCVVYTGTHDNDTVQGWYDRVDEEERDFARRYLASDGHDISWDVIRAAWGSVAEFALAPMQDLLGLGNEARMNYPGSRSGNWSWRMREEDLSELLRTQMNELNFLYGRSPFRNR